MPDNELYGLAQQAGFFPQEEDYSYAANAGQHILPPQEPQAYSETQYDKLPDVVRPPAPGVVPGANGTSVQPGQRVATSEGNSQSNSARGFDVGKFAAVDKTAGPLHDQMRATDAQAQAQGANEFGVEQDAAKAKEDAAHALASASVDKITAEGHQASLMQGLQDSFANDEAKINAASQAESAKAKADYMVALTDFRASKVDPSQLWHGMSGGQRFGTLASVFVHDFLGAKGIHTSAMDTLNTAIDRNINAQIEAIKVKGEVASGFKDLWYMQRSQSASDAEARTRVRGFLLESTKQQVIANMSKYEAGMATAQGQAAIAAIDGELAKQFIEISHHVDENMSKRRDQALSEWATKLNNAQASYATASANKRAKEENKSREKIAAMKTGEGGPKAADVIFNPETGKGEWVFKDGTDPQTKRDVKNKITQIQNVNRQMEELRRLERSTDPTSDLFKGTRLSTEDQRKFDAIADAIAHGMAKANNERATDQDVAQFRKQLPQATTFTRGGTASILAWAQKNGLESAQGDILQWADPLAQPIQGSTTAPFEGARTEAGIVADRKDKDTTYEQREAKEAIGQLAGPESEQLYKGNAANIRAAHEYFQKNLPPQAKQAYDEAAKNFRGSQVDLAEAASNGNPRDLILGAEVSLARLGQMAKNGNKDAMAELQRQAKGATMVNGDTDWKAMEAAFMLSSIGNNADLFDWNPSKPNPKPTTSVGVQGPGLIDDPNAGH